MSRTKHRPAFWITTAAVVVAAAVGLYLFQPWRLLTTERVNEAAPVADARQGATATPSATGAFISHEHETSGAVEILRGEDGKATLRLTNLRTSDGPALHVWLSDQPVRRGDGGNLDDGKHVDLGSLKGNEGNQNYAIPAGTDLKAYSTVTIWCERFSASFGAAELKQRA
ncbi:DM13 domain-containing protein [Streptomyces sp. NPDC096136]|uniref:DM13 domain-containing protein n=1 Tax=Streptomyces sp. NPDC096136 TaxID=3366076 RepID=UPI003818F7CE